jgi:hypothetical protein
MKIVFSRKVVEKYSNITFHENSFRGSCDVTCGLTGMTKLIVVFRIYAKVPKGD